MSFTALGIQSIKPPYMEQLGELIYWVVFFGVLTLVMRWFSQWFNKKTPEKDRISDTEANELSKRDFPAWYDFFMIPYVLAMVGVAGGAMVLSAFFITKYSEWLLQGKDILVVSANPSALFVALLAFLPGLVIGSLAAGLVYDRFPKYVEYIEYVQLVKWGVRTKASSKTMTMLFVKLAVGSLIIVLPLIFLAADNYYYVDKQNLYYNPFLGFTEKSISLNELEKVGVSAWKNDSMNWEYVLVFNSGEEFDLKEADTSDLTTLDSYLADQGIPLEVRELHEEALVWTNNRGTEELKILFDQIFSEDR